MADLSRQHHSFPKLINAVNLSNIYIYIYIYILFGNGHIKLCCVTPTVFFMTGLFYDYNHLSLYYCVI